MRIVIGLVVDWCRGIVHFGCRDQVRPSWVATSCVWLNQPGVHELRIPRWGLAVAGSPDQVAPATAPPAGREMRCCARMNARRWIG